MKELKSKKFIEREALETSLEIRLRGRIDTIKRQGIKRAFLKEERQEQKRSISSLRNSPQVPRRGQ